jgi:hypothetical protein
MKLLKIRAGRSFGEAQLTKRYELAVVSGNHRFSPSL